VISGTEIDKGFFVWGFNNFYLRRATMKRMIAIAALFAVCFRWHGDLCAGRGKGRSEGKEGRQLED